MDNLISASYFSLPKDEDEVNQDTILPPIKINGGWLFAVADGLGGYNGGNLASQAVISYIQNNAHEICNKLFKNLFEKLKEEVKVISETNKELVNAASTLTLCFIKDGYIKIAHIGDCRLYIRQGSKLMQITKDHTQHQNLIDDGIFTARELKNAKGKNILTTAISRTLELQYFIHTINLTPDEQGITNIYIMSDGAHSFWEKRPRFSMNTLSEPARFCSSLLRRIANGPAVDDYSLIAVKIKT